MLEKYKKLILLGIIIVGFALRYYGALNCCVVWDERQDFISAREISLDLKHLHMPLVDTRPEGSPMAGNYLIRAGWYIFGDNLLGARLPFVIIGTLNILLIYFLAKMELGVMGALFAASLLATCQFNITTSRIADNTNSAILFITIISLWLFYKALKNSDEKLFLINGIVIGIDFWFREDMLFLIPIYIIFLAVCPKFRFWLRNKNLWISFSISLLMALPLIYFSLDPAATRFGYIRDESIFGISLNGIGLYLGELILLAIKPFPKFFNYVAGSLDYENTMVNFALGILILISVIKSIRNRKPFIRMLLVCFLFYFIFFSFIRRNNIIQSFWSLGSLDWSCISLIPGIILAAYMLEALSKKQRRLSYFICGSLLIFMLIRALDITIYPLNGYFPRRECLLKNNYFINEADDIFRKGNNEWGKDMLEKIYQVTNKFPKYKKIAALKLARFLIKETRYNEAKQYLNYVFSQDSANREAVILRRELENKCFPSR